MHKGVQNRVKSGIIQVNLCARDTDQFSKLITKIYHLTLTLKQKQLVENESEGLATFLKYS